MVSLPPYEPSISIYGVFVFVLPNLSMYLSYCTCCDCVMLLCNENCCCVCNCVCVCVCVFTFFRWWYVCIRGSKYGLIHVCIHIFIPSFFSSFPIFEVSANNHFDRPIQSNPQYRIDGTHKHFHHSANKSIFSYFFLNSM